MPQKPIQEQLEDALTELEQQKKGLIDQQSLAAGLEADLETFKQFESEARAAIESYDKTLREFKERRKEPEKLLGKRESITHRKELGEEIKEVEGPILDEIKMKEEAIGELIEAKAAAANEAKTAVECLQKAQNDFDALKNKQVDLDIGLKDIEELVTQIESRTSEQKTADAATLFLFNELDAALERTRLTPVKELKEQMDEAFAALKVAVRQAREKTAGFEAIQAELDKETSEHNALAAGRRTNVVEKLRVKIEAASGA